MLSADNKETFYPEWSNFHFKDITCVNARKAVDMTGLKGLPVHDITFENVNFYGVREGMTIDYAKGILFNNCTITPQKENSIKHSSDILWNGKEL